MAMSTSAATRPKVAQRTAPENPPGPELMSALADAVDPSSLARIASTISAGGFSSVLLAWRGPGEGVSALDSPRWCARAGADEPAPLITPCARAGGRASARGAPRRARRRRPEGRRAPLPSLTAAAAASPEALPYNFGVNTEPTRGVADGVQVLGAARKCALAAAAARVASGTPDRRTLIASAPSGAQS
jgi:hypothetical protein